MAATSSGGVWVHVAIPGGNAGVAGPFSGHGQFQLVTAGIHTYPTQQAAQAAPAQTLNATQVHIFEQVVLEGPGIGQGFFGLGQNAAQVGHDLASPIEGIAEIGAVLKAFFTALTDVSMWRSLFYIVFGAALIFAGIRLWLGKPVFPSPSVVPVPV